MGLPAGAAGIGLEKTGRTAGVTERNGNPDRENRHEQRH